MFDIGAAELLLIVIVAILVIGPSEMPRALRTAGQWIAKVRRVSGHFRSGLDAMVREAEIEEMEKEWKEKNAKIMAEHPAEMLPSEPESGIEPEISADLAIDPSSAEAKAAAEQVNSEDPYPPVSPVEDDPDILADAARQRARPKKAPADEPPLPFGTKGEG